MRNLQLRVGDIGFALASGDLSLELEAAGPTRQFIVAAERPDVRLRASWANADDAAPGEMLFNAGSLWSVYRQDGGYFFRFTAPNFGPAPYKTAWFDKDFTSGEVFLNGDCFPKNDSVYPLEYPLDELLMINLLARGRGVEVHACGLRDSNGQGHLFLGASGAGKSTTARLWRERPGVRVLSEDRIILRLRNQRLWMYGTPWHGEADLACSLIAPVTRIFLLARGRHNEAVPLRETEAVARMMACSFVPFFNPEGLEFTLAFLQRAVQTVPCMEFRFVPDDQAVSFVRDSEV